MGLVALWREGLLAQKVLQGRTKGYRHHPQLIRFRAAKDPVAAIGAYLWTVAREASARGYAFDASKIVIRPGRVARVIAVTRGQLEYERLHLSRKLRVRDRTWLKRLKGTGARPHPLFRVVAGDVEPWEIRSLKIATDEHG